MHQAVYQAFEEICAAARITGPVLEVGAVAGPDGLLSMSCLAGASERVGLNQEPQGPGILLGNANHMDMFEDGRFQAVLSNATLEHDPYFWRTVEEMHRVTARGGLLVIGVPGYQGMGPHTFLSSPRWAARALRFIANHWQLDVLRAGTPTLGEHNFPGDYYRFSAQAMREVLLAGLLDVQVRHVLCPPRVIGYGRKA